MGREVALLLIVVILAIGGVRQEREPGTKVVLSGALCVRACECARTAAAPASALTASGDGPAAAVGLQPRGP